MSLEVGQATVALRTDMAGLDKGLAEAKGKVSKALNDIDADTKTHAGNIGGAIAGFFSGVAIGTVIETMGNLVKMGQQAQVNEARLRQSVISSGASWNDYAKVLERVIAARRVFAFTDSAQQAALSVLIQTTGSVEEAIKREAIAMDLARAKGIDLVTAATLLSRVNDDSVGSLKRMGFAIREGADAEEVLAVVHAATSDQALGYSKLDIAAAERRANAWDNAKEHIGQALSGMLGPIANVSTSVQGFGTTFAGSAGAIIGFSKAGKGTIPVLSGLVTAIKSVGSALKLLFLNPVGLVILAIAAFAFGLHVLYDRVEPVRNALNALGSTLLRIVPGLQWVMDRLGDVGKALGIVGDDADALGDDFTRGTDKAKKGVKSLQDQITTLSDMLKPAGADETKAFLQAIGADEATINTALDALYNEVGATQQTRQKKLLDRGYKDLVETFKQSDAYKEAKENLADFLELDPAEQDKLAKSLGRSGTAAYLKELKQNSADADKLLEHYSQTLAGAIKNAKDVTQADLDAGSRINSHIRSIDAIATAWDAARLASAYYYTGVLSGGLNVTPKLPPGAPHDVAPVDIGPGVTGGGGNPQLVSMVLNQDLHYTGDTAAMAAGAAAGVVDGITEAFRQGDRRLTTA